METETITTIAAIVGVLGDLLAITGYFSKSNQETVGFTIPLLNSLHKRFYSYIFTSATWVLVVLVWFLGFEPYGSLVTDRELNQLIAIILSLPVGVAFLFSMKHLFGNEK